MAASDSAKLPNSIRKTLVTGINLLIFAVVLWIIFYKLFHTHFDVTVHFYNGKE